MALQKLETFQLILCMLVSAEKTGSVASLGDSGGTLDDGELDAVFVEAVRQCGFCKSSSWSINSSPGNT